MYLLNNALTEKYFTPLISSNIFDIHLLSIKSNYNHLALVYKLYLGIVFHKMLAWFLCRKRYNVRLLPHVTDLVYVELHNRNNCSVVKAKIFLFMMKLKRIF